jgi:outer membrane autotransporter protein
MVGGGESVYWVRSYGGQTQTYLALDAFALVYPQQPSGFWLKGGVGIHGMWTDLTSFAATDRLGFGLSVGAGYDFRVSSALAVTPKVSFSRGNLRDTAASVFAAGMRLTLY